MKPLRPRFLALIATIAACATLHPLDAAAQNLPDAPAVVVPPPSATLTQLAPRLSVEVTDADADHLTVTFYGRPVTTPDGPDFTLIEIPDTQFYSGGLNGGAPWMFSAQTRWIARQRAARNIAYVAHVGDIVQNEDNNGDPVEWIVADSCMAHLEDPVATLLPEGIPFGAVPGNHDIQANGEDLFYNQYFGLDRFQSRGWYGGHFGNDNSSWFHLFSASGLDFIVIGLKLEWFGDPAAIQWADSLLTAYADRRAILVSHYLLDPGPPVTFSTQGQMIYDALKGHDNLFLMLCGHFVDEARRADTYADHTIHTVMANYQGRSVGGDGWLRIMEFSPARDQVRFRTYSPTRGQYESDADSSSQFTLDLDLGGGDGAFHPIGTVHDVPAGATVSIPWAGLQRGVTYEWYATVSDMSGTVTGPTWQFETVEDTNPSAVLTVPNGAEMLTVTHDLGVSWETANLPGPHQVDIEISRSGSEGPWEAIATQLPDAGSYTWRVSGPVTHDAYVRVVVRNDQQVEVVDRSDMAFAITAPPVTGIEPGPRPVLALDPVVPNPTRGRSLVSFSLARTGPVRLDVVDVTGRQVAKIAHGSLIAGPHQFAWDGMTRGTPAPAGLYFVRLHAENRVITRRIALIR